MNPIDVEVFRHRFQSVAEEMGVVLRQAAFSANIKERLDFSCAITDRDGFMVAQAAHIPVHLGSCHLTARFILGHLELAEGDVICLNDPFRGGTHLPDVTFFMPVFLDGESTASFGVISRAHHADIGGGVPGSMGNFDEIFKEGLIIPPVKIVVGGVLNQDVLSMILANVRTPEERQGDLMAQLASVRRGAERLKETAVRYGRDLLGLAGTALMDRSERSMRQLIQTIPNGAYSFRDVLDERDGPVIEVCLTVDQDHIEIDFEGSSPALDQALNAHEAITLSCVFYAIRCLASEEVPTNSGILRPLKLTLPNRTIVSAEHPSAVAAGNVETSQRIVDVLFGALAQALPDRIPAASQGTMNNVSFGGSLPESGLFTYFETLAGGIGAGPSGDGASGLHSHMTNTRNTPVEALELSYPLRVRRYELRSGSGGDGANKGGEGIVREYESLLPMTLSLLTTRRATNPWGLRGGGEGAAGNNILIRADEETSLPSCGSIQLAPGDRVRITTPGGGGFLTAD
ncbi:MAG: N-methylhydantoinase B [Planctomycetota bacterium]|jgi:N-methylhydantoinase B